MPKIPSFWSGSKDGAQNVERGQTNCPEDTHEIEAMLSCELYIKSLMQSPRSARYYRCEAINVSWEGPRYKVSSFFDVPNSAGPAIRTYYNCLLMRDPYGALMVTNYRIDDMY